MNGLPGLVLLPVRAPMLLLLLLISVYLGTTISLPEAAFTQPLPPLEALAWGAECLQAMLVVVVCSIPDLLLRQISSLMASSRVISLVISLLLVTMAGLYMLHLEVLSVVLILGSSVLLARLDLLRIRVVPPPLRLTVMLCLLVLVGLNVGRVVGARIQPPSSAPRAESRGAPEPGEPGRSLQQEGRRSL